MNQYINTIVRKINEGKVVLFLGSGVNFECLNSSGVRAPVGSELAKLIKQQFLPDEELPDELQMVSACVETRESRKHLDRFIYDCLIDFEPCDLVLKQIPKLVWRRIYTTNYDILLEKAYNQIAEKKQRLIPIYSDRDRQDNITLGVDLPYYKVHGCITKITSESLPLTLTAEDYAKYRDNRKRLFWRLQDDFYEHTFLFIGYSLLDSDFQSLFYEVQADVQDLRDFPRCYALSPNMPQAISDYWDSRKVVVLNYKASEFFALMKDTHAELPDLPKSQNDQILTLTTDILPNLNKELARDLLKSFEFVSEKLGYEQFNYKDFYRGDKPNWSIIRNDCDAQRDFYDLIMEDILLVDEEEKPDKVEVTILTAEAGGGKSTLLMRLAYDLAYDYEKFCLYHKSLQDVSFSALEDLYRNIKKRIYIYIDDAADNIGQLTFIARRAKSLNVPVTIIGAERKNEWNSVKERLLPLVPIEYELPYLSKPEIENILKVLENNDFLCELRHKSHEDRISTFMDKADKQLLVAMREATEGDDFENIIRNEYDEIPSELGKKTYLTICSLHRLGVKIRAGLLRRLSGVSFADFQKKLLEPCERVIVVEQDEASDINYYRTRHPYIAEMVCRYMLSDPTKISELYIKVLDSMDIGYSSDLYSFRELVRADPIIDAMPNIEHRRLFYNKALLLSGSDAFVHQQFGIMELRHNNISDAEEHLGKACSIEPKNQAYKHSYARLLYDKSQATSNPVLKDRFFNKAQKTLTEIIHSWPTNPYAYNSYTQNLIDRAIKAEKEQKEEDLKEAHEMILNGLRFCYEKSYLLATEGRIFQCLGKYDEAKASLYKSHSSNKSSVRTAMLLSRLLIHNRDYESAYEVIAATIRFNELHVTINFMAAETLIKIDPMNHDKIISHLKKAFDPTYVDYKPNYLLALEYFKADIQPESDKIFLEFKKRKIFKRNRDSYKVSDYLMDGNGRQKRFEGEIANMFGNRGYIKADLIAREIFFHPDFDKAKIGSRVSFAVGFNLFGPIARFVHLKK